MSVEGYTLGRSLGQGTYGQVWEATENATGRRCAVKVLTLESEDEGVPSTLMREISALKDLVHANIVALRAIQLPSTKQVNLVFEMAEADLKNFITTWKREHPMTQGLGHDLTRIMLFQLCRGMAHCHAKGYMHRDLKPPNLLVNSAGLPFPVLKIADFGLSRATTIPVKKYVDKVVTLWYRAPELLLGETRYTTAIDVWSIGCIFAEMATGMPFLNVKRDGNEQDELAVIVQRFGKPPAAGPQAWPEGPLLRHGAWLAALPDSTPVDLAVYFGACMDAEALDLLSLMMTWNPARRITCAGALEHPYFRHLPPQVREFDPLPPQ